jgi:hypothetical protein
MRRSSLFLICSLLLVLSFGLAQGQNALYVTAVQGEFGTPPDDTLQTGATIKWTIALRIAAGDKLIGSNNGFIVFSPDGATWGIPVLDTLNIKPTTGFGWKERYDFGVFKYHAPSNNGSGTIAGADTVGIGGLSNAGIDGLGTAFGSGFDFDVLTISLPGGVPDASDGLHLCLDSSGYDVNAEWLWSAADTKPDWSGQACYTLFDVPNQPPNITNCVASITQSHCDLASKQFTAEDVDALGARPLTFVQNSGPGSTTLAGLWSYAPSLADVGASLTLSVSAQDDPGNLGPACEISLNFTNVCPSFTDGCGALVPVGKGNSAQADVDAVSGDCDPISYSLGAVSPAPPVGTYSINPATGTVTFNSDEADGGNTFCFEVIVSDGDCAVSCEVCFEVLVVEPYTIQIEKTHQTIQGQHELVCVSLNTGSEQLWGFDLLIAYDNSALSLVDVLEGEIYDECGWEYFNWRFGANGNCGGSCPSGLVRVVGLAETNNGPNHPDCYLPANLPTTLFCLDFLVTNDRTFECQYVPIRFYWVDCGDNTVSFHPSDGAANEQRLGVSRAIYDFDFFAGDISNGNTGFPTYYGVQDFCLEGGGDGKPAPVQFIDFINGGIDIVCADSIDDRGDINLNGLSNEVADAVLFTNYFIYGINVFTVNVQGQIAATDVNADGLTLSVADLVYLIRIVIGDALPYAKLAPIQSLVPVAVGYTRDALGTMSIKDNVQIGAAFVVVSGEVTPTLLADGMEMKYDYVGSNTRILVWSQEGNSFTGNFMTVTGSIVSIDMATAEGQPVALEVLPTVFTLNQNYPNPFNPKTRISFALPTASDYTLTIYNVTGQKVTEFTGNHAAGTVEIDVDASNYSSGVYFYKLIADNGRFAETKKMVLVK